MANITMPYFEDIGDLSFSSDEEDAIVDGPGNEPDFGPLKSVTKRYRGKLYEVARVRPVASRVLDAYEDGSSSAAGWRSRGLVADGRFVAVKKGDDERGMGAVIEDGIGIGPAPSDRVPHQIKYWKWQDALQRGKNAKANRAKTSGRNLGLFALLPGELRNKIYRLVLLEVDGTFTIVGKPNTCSLGPCTHVTISRALPGLLSTGKQIRHEAMPIFCAENTIKFDARTVRQRCTANFLRAMGEYGLHIRRVILEVNTWVRILPPNPFQPPTHVQRYQEITIDCSSGFNVTLDQSMRPRINPTIQMWFEGSWDTRIDAAYKVLRHAWKLNQRAMQGEPREQLLLEFVWSDLLADLVFMCSEATR